MTHPELRQLRKQVAKQKREASMGLFILYLLGTLVIAMVAGTSHSWASTFYIRTIGTETYYIPNGFKKFCQDYRNDCGSPGRLTMISADKWKSTLFSVNNNVNKTFRYVSDVKGDHWQAGRGYGDCEDFAIQKRRDLIKAGIPASSMRYALVARPQGSHIVLIVRTDDGDRVLDNTTNAINPPNKTNYEWFAIQSRRKPWKWLTVF